MGGSRGRSHSNYGSLELPSDPASTGTAGTSTGSPSRGSSRATSPNAGTEFDQGSCVDGVAAGSAAANAGASGDGTRTVGERGPTTSKKPGLYVILCSCVAALGGFLFGWDIASVSGALPDLRDDWNLSPFEEELVVSIMLLGAVFGAAVGGTLSDKYGRRLAVMATCVIFIVSAGMVSLADGLPLLLAGRFVMGIGVAVSAIADIVYIAEIAPPGRRGALVSLNELAITIGIVSSYLFALALVDNEGGWRWIFAASAVPAGLQLIGMAFLPRSPRWLIQWGLEAEALEVLESMTGSREEAIEVAARIRKVVDAVRNRGAGSPGDDYQPQRLLEADSAGRSGGEDGTGTSDGGGEGGGGAADTNGAVGENGTRAGLGGGAVPSVVPPGDVRHGATDVVVVGAPRPESGPAAPAGNGGDGLFSRRNRPNLVIGCAFALFQQLTGHANVLSYAPEIFARAGLEDRSAAVLATVGLGVVKVLATIVALWQVDRAGRRVLTMIGAAGTALTLAVLGFAFLDASNTSVIAVSALLVFVATYAVSFGPVGWLLVSEVFPLHLRGAAVGATSVVNWGTNFVVSISFLSMLEALGPSLTFWLYAGICVVALAFSKWVMIETRGLTLEEVNKQIDIHPILGRLRHG